VFTNWLDIGFTSHFHDLNSISADPAQPTRLIVNTCRETEIFRPKLWECLHKLFGSGKSATLFQRQLFAGAKRNGRSCAPMKLRSVYKFIDSSLGFGFLLLTKTDLLGFCTPQLV